MEAHEIVGQVHGKYPKLTHRLSLITGKCKELFASHHREPKTRNRLQSGNPSPVLHYIEYIHLNEAAERGAGQMMANRTHESLMAEFAECSLAEADIHEHIIEENSDVLKWLARFDIVSATPKQLAAFERECGESIDALQDAMSGARAARRQKELDGPSGDLRRKAATATIRKFSVNGAGVNGVKG